MESTIALDDGATTTVERWGESGPVILCVHGMTSSRKAWVRFAARYSDRYRVVAYDQRGHGDSAPVRGPMSLDRGVQDLRNVAAVTGADILLGHSWGGAVVIRGGSSVNANKVIAIDPMIVQVNDEWYAEYITELEEAFALAGAARDARMREEYAEWDPVDVDGKVHAVHSMTSAPIAGLRDANRDGRWDLRSEIASYPKPLLLVMAGRLGSIVSDDVIDDIEARHSEWVEIVTLENQGHNLYRTDFEGFAAAIDPFLRRRASSF
ncbi:MAG TPA: alpha/beta hydrolase [Candidatus Acidoferrales bacterium]|nr:alpha/beta hydrolase [Candidatus Acidoferrales bacterium]